MTRRQPAAVTRSQRSPRIVWGGRSLLALSLVLPAACTGPGLSAGGPLSHVDAETAAACRQRADQVYDTRHRGTIYAPQSEVNTPFSAGYTPSIPDRGLAEVYERDSMVSDCVRNTGAEGDRMPEAGPIPSGFGFTTGPGRAAGPGPTTVIGPPPDLTSAPMPGPAARP